MFCKQCGQRIESDSVFCRFCGIEIEQTKRIESARQFGKCPQCANEDYVEDEGCQACGFVDPTSRKRNSDSSNTAARKVLAAILVILLVCLVVAGIIYNRYLNEKGEALFDDLISQVSLMQRLSEQGDGNDHAEGIADRLSIVDGWTFQTDGDQFYIRGSVQNGTARTATNYRIIAEFLDKNGNVIDSNKADSEQNLYSGDMKSFEIVHPYNEQINRVRIRLESIELE